MLRLNIDYKDYGHFRWFFTSEEKLVIGGKNEEQNEIIMKMFLKSDYLVAHTSKPGSPFMIIQTENPSKQDIKETAIFCACFSKQWKFGNKKIDVDVFKGNQVFKKRDMKTGTFSVIGERKKLSVKPELVLVIQKGKLRAVPKVKIKEEVLFEIKPGKLSKEQAAEKIAKKIKNKFLLPVSKEEIMQAIPSGNIGVS